MNDPAAVESLLRCAASWEPDTAAPSDLAARALLRGRSKQRARALAGRTLAGATLVAAALAAVGFLLPRLTPFAASSGAPPLAVSAPPVAPAAPEAKIAVAAMATSVKAGDEAERPSPALSRPLPRPARRVAAWERHKNAPVVLAGLSHRRRPSRSFARVRLARAAAAGKPWAAARRRPRAAPVPPSPRAVWQTTVVRRENYGVLAPAWVTVHDEARGGEIIAAVPVVLDMPLSDNDGANGAPDEFDAATAAIVFISADTTLSNSFNANLEESR